MSITPKMIVKPKAIMAKTIPISKPANRELTKISIKNSLSRYVSDNVSPLLSFALYKVKE
jgi:hypothetical protein